AQSGALESLRRQSELLHPGGHDVGGAVLLPRELGERVQIAPQLDQVRGGRLDGARDGLLDRHDLSSLRRSRGRPGRVRDAEAQPRRARWAAWASRLPQVTEQNLRDLLRDRSTTRPSQSAAAQTPSRLISSSRITSIIAIAVSTRTRSCSGRSSSIAWTCQSDSPCRTSRGTACCSERISLTRRA